LAAEAAATSAAATSAFAAASASSLVMTIDFGIAIPGRY